MTPGCDEKSEIQPLDPAYRRDSYKERGYYTKEHSKDDK